MAKRIKQESGPKDIDQLAEYIVDESVREGATPDRSSQAQISMLMAETGHKRVKVGGKKRSKTTSKPKRRKAAQKAAKTRRSKKKTSK